MMKRLVLYFFQGLVIVAPLAITIYIIYSIFTFLDTKLHLLLENYFEKSIPGLGVILVVVILTLLGYLAGTIIAKPFSYLMEKAMKKAPFLRLMYTSFNDLLSAFVGKEKKFNTPVMVLINKENDLWKMGFLTHKSLSDFGIEDKVTVYFPHSYTFAGEIYLVPASSVRVLTIPPSEAMKFIVSGGVTKIDHLVDNEGIKK